MTLKIAAQVKLGIALAVTLVLAMALMSWWVAGESRESSEEEHHFFLGALALTQAQSALLQLRLGVPEYVIGDEPRRKQIRAEESKWYAAFEAALDDYEGPLLTQAEVQMLVTLRAQFEAYKRARSKAFDLIDTGPADDAQTLHARTAISGAEEITQTLNRFAGLEKEHLHESGVLEILWAGRSQTVIAALCIGLLGLLALGYGGAMRVLRPILGLEQKAQTVVREHLGETIEAGKDANEIESLVVAFDKMTQAFIARTAALMRTREALKHQAETLEETVGQRTKELQTANDVLAARERQNRLVTEMTGLLQTMNDIDEAARILPRFLEPLFEPHAGALYTAKPSLNYLDLRVQWGEPSFPDMFEFNECWALRRGEFYAVQSSGLVCPRSASHPAEAYLCVPMVTQGTIFGLLHIAYVTAADSKEAKRDRRGHAHYISEQLSLALANLRLREALRDQALRDSLTGLFNRRYLEESLVREIARAEREERPLSVLMIDVDHFKRFNDANGHDAGDAVLRSLGRLLAECSRAGDIACRFGGEEFAVILVGASVEESATWAERLLDRARTMVVRNRGQSLPTVTISVGLSSFPADGRDVEALLKVADLALYDAKRAGRDRLVVAGKPPPPADVAEVAA